MLFLRIAAVTAGLLAAAPVITAVAAYADTPAVTGPQTHEQAPRFTPVASRNDYFRCADFSLRVYNACLQQAAGDPAKSRRCRQHYQGNITRCQAQYR